RRLPRGGRAPRRRTRVRPATNAALGSCATLCYMAERNRSQVGVRELRQNLSVYLDRVKAGESLVVTERGAAVARLPPRPRGRSSIERLIEAGRATPASGSLMDLDPPRALAGPSLSATLAALREEEA